MCACVCTCTLSRPCFSLPSLLPTQVDEMVGYAVGEMVKPSANQDGREREEEEEEAVTRWRPRSHDCYEVVTAWVHPRFIINNRSLTL